MSYRFPSSEWLKALEENLNSDEQYAQIARDWEGDIQFVVKLNDTHNEEMRLYLDLWHGKCRRSFVLSQDDELDHEPKFTLSAPRANFIQILTGELDPLQAMMTRKLQVKGNMIYMMRNVPVILDFVRCTKEIPTTDLSQT
jgi:putative sterol carrier protein